LRPPRKVLLSARMRIAVSMKKLRNLGSGASSVLNVTF